jgi:hypothetical protein
LLTSYGLQVVPCTKEQAACPNANGKDGDKSYGSSKMHA